MTDRYLPTIEQIIRKGDSLGNVPMEQDEAREWFEQTYEDNRERASKEPSHDRL